MKPLANRRKPRTFGRIRQSDNSLIKAGINAGDLIVVDLTRQPKQDELCAVFTAQSELLIRYYHREQNGNIRLTRRVGDKDISFAPSAVIIFGCVQEIVKSATAA